MPLLTSLSQNLISGTRKSSGIFQKKFTLSEPVPANNNEFGISVDIYNNDLIVGAFGFNNFLGRAYVYNLTNGTLKHTLSYPGGNLSNVQFGISVASSSSGFIVGAPGDGANSLEGKAYIFNTDGTLRYTLNNPVAGMTKEFGITVGISESYAVVGAPLEDAGGSRRGRAYIYSLSNGALLHTINNPNAFGDSNLDQFGNAVDITDNYMIAAAYQEEDAGGSISGKAYIFDPASGALLQTLDNPNLSGSSANDSFGTKVSISPLYSAVSAPPEASQSGVVYIFDNSNGTLLLTLTNPNRFGTPEGDKFGTSISITNDYVLVGAPEETDFTVSNSGAAYLFSLPSGNLIKTFNNPNDFGTKANDIFGISVAVSDTFAAIGASREDNENISNSGRVYVYK